MKGLLSPQQQAKNHCKAWREKKREAGRERCKKDTGRERTKERSASRGQKQHDDYRKKRKDRSAVMGLGGFTEGERKTVVGGGTWGKLRPKKALTLFYRAALKIESYKTKQRQKKILKTRKGCCQQKREKRKHASCPKTQSKKGDSSLTKKNPEEEFILLSNKRGGGVENERRKGYVFEEDQAGASGKGRRKLVGGGELGSYKTPGKKQIHFKKWEERGRDCGKTKRHSPLQHRKYTGEPRRKKPCRAS